MQQRILKKVTLLLLCTLFTFISYLFGDSTDNTLFNNFQNPPESAKPRTWWHWTGGNVTRQGISKDLEWMQRAGIAGFQLADVRFGSGQTVNNKILFGTEDWLSAVHYTAQEAKRLDLEMAIFSLAGYSLTGGPVS